MSNFDLTYNSETFDRMRLAEQEQRLMLHNNLIQRILKLRDKLSSTMSLTELSIKIDELEKDIYSGSDLEQIEQEIIVIEKIVSQHFHRLLQFFNFEILPEPESKISQTIRQAREINQSEKV